MSEPGEKAKLPELPFNRSLLNSLNDVNTVLALRNNSPLSVSPNEVSLLNGKDTLVTITSTDILIAGSSFQNRLVVPGQESPYLQDNAFKVFLQSISNRIIRLNHLGINYFCGGLKFEEERISAVARNARIPLQSDSDAEAGQTWLFMGDRSGIEKPLFEFVLNQGEPVPGDYSRPHFQIDLDTDMSRDEIHTASQMLRPNFIHWELDIPGYGTVLSLGILANINGTKIALGLGTNVRPVKEHRSGMKQIFK